MAGRRSYVKQGDFFDLQPRDPEQLLWTSSENLALVVAATYLLYAPCVYALALVPAPNEVEGGYFFSLVSIIFGTLTASTISDATQRLSSLRAAIVDECSLMLPLLERLTIVLHENDREGQDRERLFVACANQLWLHVTDIISGTREIELELMSSREYFRRADIPRTGRGGAAAARRGYSVERSRGDERRMPQVRPAHLDRQRPTARAVPLRDRRADLRH